ncbi:MAG: hypothetical protein AAF352_03420 [Pseudomonadota bacterium]
MSEYIQYFTSLVFVIGLFLAITILWRRWMDRHGGVLRRLAQGKQMQEIQINHMVVVDSRRKLMSMDWRGKSYLIMLGVSSETVVATDDGASTFEDALKNKTDANDTNTDDT